MPHYRFRCANPTCQRERELRRTMRERNTPTSCPTCGAPMQRLLTVPFLTCQRFLDCDENRYAFGFSETERTENRKRDDALYAQHYQKTGDGI